MTTLELRDLTDEELWWKLKYTNNVEKINKIKDELVIREIIDRY